LDPGRDCYKANPTHQIDRVGLEMVASDRDPARQAQNEYSSSQTGKDYDGNGRECCVVPDADLKTQQCFHDCPQSLRAHPALANAFKDWRYVFEGEGRQLRVNLLVAFTKAVYKTIRLRRPDWEVRSYRDGRIRAANESPSSDALGLSRITRVEPWLVPQPE
jgi:hypothetical protein